MAFFCSISNGRRQSRAETCPACTQAMRVNMDPARLEIAATFLNLRERRGPEMAAAMRNASGTGPLSTPPSRVMSPLVPRFKGSTAGFFEISIFKPSSKDSMAAAAPESPAY